MITLELRRAARDYLSIRRALGFKLRGHDRLLEDFIGFLDRCASPTIVVTSELAVVWATRAGTVGPVRAMQRLCVVRGFTRHLAAMDPSAPVQVPPTDLLTCSRRRPTPYLFSDNDIHALLTAAAKLQPPFRAATHHTLFALLVVSGLRIGEAIALDRGDVDLTGGQVAITNAKFRKHRRLPLHPSTVAALTDYAARRDVEFDKPVGQSFFVTAAGARLTDHGVRTVFRELLRRVDQPEQPGAGRPRIHSLRHGFAVATLRDWYAAGADVNSKLPILSAYLGHADPASTYWYLQATPELLAAAADRLEQFMDPPQ
ncbi:MAG: tyrosine-type recombinase/integrase [Chloroflexota bacterium]|nr:tyrosine-type recombinase/integrase [Chloroflexota bacterium]